jgi:hypothetical protein
MKIQIVFYSIYGQVYRMAEAVAKGARGVEGARERQIINSNQFRLFSY